jgi:hypothetical protein
MNSVNRAMGMRDLYRLILSPAVIRKLGFIHNRVQEVAAVKGTAVKGTAVKGR